MMERKPGIAIIGAGTLGRHIARLMAVRDVDIAVFDTDPVVAREAAETATRLAQADQPAGVSGRIEAVEELAAAVTGR